MTSFTSDHVCLNAQLGQPIRLLLKYNGLEFDNVMYEQGDGRTMVIVAVSSEVLYLQLPIIREKAGLVLNLHLDWTFQM